MTPDHPTAPVRKRFTSGSEFERQYNYSRAVQVGNHLMISGTTGYDYATSTLAETAAAQTEQLIRNVEKVLAQAGGTLADIVRVRMYLAYAADYDIIMDVYARAFVGICPACTTVEAKLFDPAIRIEMDMDAIIDARA
ncbi:Rid family hydrolase [Niveispirillum sp.]|uniref:Rid family hydrolase n=1 Tax=Niveispirillum sp. TaxID=1917217 RepID=UPI001B5C31AD|nr:Rid family hydrolase [Niveispirillum sp.]MBP7337425.1 RidA family protein [Niveispirillum sp.]